MPKNILPINGNVVLYPSVIDAASSEQLLQSLQSNICWREERIRIFGKWVMQPRLTAWYADAGKTYQYSGIEMTPLAWTDELLAMKNVVEHYSGQQFNSVLLNWYRNGKDSMGWHSDDEKELGKNPVIASLSFGAERVFKLKHKREKQLKESIVLPAGSLLLMSGETQHHWYHALPKTNKQVGARINLTFRKIR